MEPPRPSESGFQSPLKEAPVSQKTNQDIAKYCPIARDQPAQLDGRIAGTRLRLYQTGNMRTDAVFTS